MIEAARVLSSDVDHTRVDFYNVGRRVYFGEMTLYHGSGLLHFFPDSFDFELGACWTQHY